MTVYRIAMVVGSLDAEYFTPKNRVLRKRKMNNKKLVTGLRKLTND